MKMTREREKMVSGRNDAADPQPWRCTKCNEPVSHIRKNPCKCIRDLEAAQKVVDGGSAIR